MNTRFRRPTPTRGGAPSHSPPDVHYLPGIGLSRALGWFGIGLGILEIAATHELARATGVHPRRLRVYGVREIACGLGILGTSRPTAWVWMRVLGDVLDLTALAFPEDRQRSHSFAAGLAVAGVTVLDVLNGLQLTAAERLEG